MPRECYKGCDPETDETAIDCNGEFIGQDCIVVEQNTYLELEEGDKLTDFISKVVLKFQALSLSKIDKALSVYTDDAEASAGGVLVGQYYIDDNGFVKRRMA